MNAPTPPQELPASSPAPEPAAHSLAKDFARQVLTIAAASIVAGLIVEHFKGGGKSRTTYVVVNEEGEIIEEITP
jgi:hypothetical protein